MADSEAADVSFLYGTGSSKEIHKGKPDPLDHSPRTDRVSATDTLHWPGLLLLFGKCLSQNCAADSLLILACFIQLLSSGM